MARVPQARHFLGWLGTSLALALAGCVIVDQGDDDDDDVGGGQTPGPAPTSSAPAASPEGPAGEVFSLVNQARARARSCGDKSFPAAAPLRWSEPLARAARAHSEDMAARDYFSHVTPENKDLADRVAAQGYAFSALGENIAAGQRSAADAVEGWLASPGHCENIMSGAFQDIGIGRAEGGSFGVYWTQKFAAPR
ncbi:MAG TPA: CAP domain-containing protein [Polyangiaceae bacterium]|nr:CAP domain-containing protein [Polyangiaceae bacterium]